jgi:DNA-directed RNA polymerase specialized sigma24 family protein
MQSTGKNYKKAAEELHISKYTVKEYLSEALVSIKNILVNTPDKQDNYLLFSFHNRLLLTFTG